MLGRSERDLDAPFLYFLYKPACQSYSTGIIAFTFPSFNLAIALHLNITQQQDNISLLQSRTRSHLRQLFGQDVGSRLHCESRLQMRSGGSPR